ncbi:MAG: RNA polymerase sigma factor [Minisyncoccia bacterium]
MSSSGKEKETVLTDAFETYSDELFRHAYFRLSDREKAVELVQEAYLRAWEYLRKGEEIQNPRAFLYRTLRNLIIDEYRKKKTYSVEALLEKSDGEEGDIDALLPSDESNTFEAATERLDAKAAFARISELPDAYAEVILLRFVDGLSLSEIAPRVDASENLVSVRIHRALKALRTLIEEKP